MGGRGEEEVVRIFVGGLDAGVTASDVEKRFSLSPSLGKVMGVQLITKNNQCSMTGNGGGIGCNSTNFAYIDFQPSSPNSLTKLFSIYNGCVWKRGRLRLEKANEHHLARLKREWEEDARLANDDAPKDDVDRGGKMQETPKQSDRSVAGAAGQEKMQLQIFFPKFKKVKSLPYTGTGKHKYSFQRVEVPSLPVHFCDCEEHCKPLETASREQLSTLRIHLDGVNAVELDVMNSVMNKLFKRVGIVNAADTVMASDDAGNNSRCAIDDVLYNEMEATEEDDLLTNIVMDSTHESSVSMQADGVEKTVDEVLKDFKISSSMDGPQQRPTKLLKRKNTLPANALESNLSKKVCPFTADESVKDEFPNKFEKRSSEVDSKELKSSKEAQHSGAQMKPDDNQSARGVAWVQKSSWRELVGEASSSPFSISHILPGRTSMKPSLPKLGDVAVVNAISSEVQKPKKRTTQEVDEKQLALKDKLISSHDPNVETLKKGGKVQMGLIGESSTRNGNLEMRKDKILRVPEESKKKVDADRRATLAAIGIGEVCTFMRNADSEREWTKARAALTASRKKKNKESSSKNS